MSESGFSLKVRSKTLEDGMLLVQTFRELYSMGDKKNKDQIRNIINKGIGEQFSNVIFSRLSTDEDLESIRDYLPSGANSEIAWRMAKGFAKDKEHVWLGANANGIEPEWLCPEYMEIHTRSHDYGDYYTRIELTYDNVSDEAPIKAAVFSKALTESGFMVDNPFLYNDLEDEEEY